jgi:hypothetical protein
MGYLHYMHNKKKVIKREVISAENSVSDESFKGNIL